MHVACSLPYRKNKYSKKKLNKRKPTRLDFSDLVALWVINIKTLMILCVNASCALTYSIISYHIISYHIISYHIISYHIMSYLILSSCSLTYSIPAWSLFYLLFFVRVYFVRVVSNPRNSATIPKIGIYSAARTKNLEYRLICLYPIKLWIRKLDFSAFFTNKSQINEKSLPMGRQPVVLLTIYHGHQHKCS